MSDLISKLKHQELVFFLLLLIIIFTFLFGGLILFFGVLWHLTKKAEIAAALKQDMLNRGMSQKRSAR
jgi:hypothetical protein